MSIPLSNTHYIDMLFLELSQFTTATTKKELDLKAKLERALELAKERCWCGEDLVDGHGPEYVCSRCAALAELDGGG